MHKRPRKTTVSIVAVASLLGAGGAACAPGGSGVGPDGAAAARETSAETWRFEPTEVSVEQLFVEAEMVGMYTAEDIGYDGKDEGYLFHKLSREELVVTSSDSWKTAFKLDREGLDTLRRSVLLAAQVFLDASVGWRLGFELDGDETSKSRAIYTSDEADATKYTDDRGDLFYKLQEGDLVGKDGDIDTGIHVKAAGLFLKWLPAGREDIDGKSPAETTIPIDPGRLYYNE